MIGDGVGPRAPHLSVKQSFEARLLPDRYVMLIVYVEDVELPLAPGKAAAP